MSPFFSTFLQSGKAVPNLDAKTFESEMNNDSSAVLLDVRTPQEHSESRIPNSILINIMDTSFQDKIEKLDRSKSYYVYCRSGNRSFHAGNTILKMGFEKVYNLASGITGWHGKIERD